MARQASFDILRTGSTNGFPFCYAEFVVTSVIRHVRGESRQIGIRNDLVISPFFEIEEGEQGDEVLPESKEVQIINITPYPLTPRPFVRYTIWTTGNHGGQT
jgi:hypothetical protein